MGSGRQPTIDLLVHRMTREAEDILSVELVHPEGKPLPAWTAGAHIDVCTGGQVRQYSLCGDPADPGHYRIAVHRAAPSRGGSAFVHTALRPGDLVTVAGPRNHFELDDAESYVFVAGGIGIVPLLAHAREARARGRRWQLWYGGRSRAALAFAQELADLAADGGHVVLATKDENQRLDLGTVLDQAPPGALIYSCGPERLLTELEARCKERDMADRHRTEWFAGQGAKTPDQDERPFEVVCRTSGLTVQVGPKDTIVDVLEDAGVYVEASCRDGVCGTCETPFVDGVPDHRDQVLTDAERTDGNTMIICVSRSLSPRLVLDL